MTTVETTPEQCINKHRLGAFFNSGATVYIEPCPHPGCEGCVAVNYEAGHSSDSTCCNSGSH